MITTLAESQEGIAQKIVTSIRDHSCKFYLQGLSGSGKSTICERVAQILGVNIEPFYVRYPDEHTISEDESAPKKGVLYVNDCESFRDVIDVVQEKITVLLTGREKVSPRIQEIFVEEGVQEIKVPKLSRNEITSLARSSNESITDEEIELVINYSLGLPLLVSAMSRSKPCDRQMLGMILETYITDISHYHINTTEALYKFLKEELDEVTDEIKAVVERCDPGNGGWKSHLYAVQATLLQNNWQLPKACTIPLYEEWVTMLNKGRGSMSSCVFVPDTGNKYEIVIEELGTPNNTPYAHGRLRTICSQRHKTTWWHNDKYQGAYTQKTRNPKNSSVNAFLRLANVGGYDNEGKKLKDDDIIVVAGKRPFFIDASDHFGLIYQPLSVALVTESLLQELEIPYYIYLGGLSRYYDPVTQKYREISPEEQARCTSS